jgi:hypothetical protein
MKHLCGFVWKIFGGNNFATILLYCGKKVSSSLFLLTSPYNYAVKIGRGNVKMVI